MVRPVVGGRGQRLLEAALEGVHRQLDAAHAVQAGLREGALQRGQRADPYVLRESG
ncbi:hypothetical protein [Azospirillum argentinense]|uniref:hypothetical protein n=1 Tax=Azospirillum argentinense TaxID=2970906 RepID=UPI0015862C07|nr:hypothetical protein [Azospirillum argentinense]